MSVTTKYSSGTIATLLSTELNSLANNALVIVTSAYDNSSNLHILTEIELVVTFGTAPSVNTGIYVWFLRNIDGTNYEDGSASVEPGRAPDIFMPVRAVTTAQRVTRRCIIPPGTFKTLLKNGGTGQSFASSGNTLKILPLTYQGV